MSSHMGMVIRKRLLFAVECILTLATSTHFVFSFIFGTPFIEHSAIGTLNNYNGNKIQNDEKGLKG